MVVDLISTFYLISGWYNNFLLKKKDILVKKVLKVSQTHSSIECNLYVIHCYSYDNKTYIINFLERERERFHYIADPGEFNSPVG